MWQLGRGSAALKQSSRRRSMQTGLYRRSRSALPGTAMRAQTLQTRRRGIPREKHSVIVFSTRPARCELASVERRRRPQPRGDVIARTCWRSVLYRGEGAYGRTWANMGKEASKGLIQSFVSAERRVTKHRRRQERREGSAKAFPTRKLTCSSVADVLRPHVQCCPSSQLSSNPNGTRKW
jgi:hypothetical protein